VKFSSYCREKPSTSKTSSRLALSSVKQGQGAAAQFGLHVEPGRKDALASDAGRVVEQRVENFAAEVGHPDLVGIGESQAHPRPHGCRILADLVVFATHVARRLLDLGQKRPRRVAGRLSIIARSGTCPCAPVRGFRDMQRPPCDGSESPVADATTGGSPSFAGSLASPARHNRGNLGTAKAEKLARCPDRGGSGWLCARYAGRPAPNFRRAGRASSRRSRSRPALCLGMDGRPGICA